eukprot:TRINITY_DN6905_c0_g1_i1.p1 TRINITY_DN6905_c0_g1~~TRINITY_DN6905_c0_g1_i1.p1  ORF type:complete len:137 (+),score=27.18 TRINITY_DN6905_c0_g1_i1:70-480(+)
MSVPYTFTIVGKNDNPLYEAEFASGVKAKEQAHHLSQFVIHSSIDLVEEAVWKSTAMNLKGVDRFGKSYISSFVTAGHIKFMLLHEKKEEDAIKGFFQDVYELYVKIAINPFYQLNTPITSVAFDSRVKKLGAKYF